MCLRRHPVIHEHPEGSGFYTIEYPVLPISDLLKIDEEHRRDPCLSHGSVNTSTQLFLLRHLLCIDITFGIRAAAPNLKALCFYPLRTTALDIIGSCGCSWNLHLAQKEILLARHAQPGV